MEKNGKEFEFNYTAPSEAERKEIVSIRRQYEPQGEKKESKMERLRRLDAHVKNSANAISLVLGICGVLVFGLGLTMMLEWALYFCGVVVGVVGAIPTALAYPVYKSILKKNKQKYGKEILDLTEELLKEREEI